MRADWVEEGRGAKAQRSDTFISHRHPLEPNTLQAPYPSHSTYVLGLGKVSQKKMNCKNYKLQRIVKIINCKEEFPDKVVAGDVSQSLTGVFLLSNVT